MLSTIVHKDSARTLLLVGMFVCSFNVFWTI